MKATTFGCTIWVPCAYSVTYVTIAPRDCMTVFDTVLYVYPRIRWGFLTQWLSLREPGAEWRFQAKVRITKSPVVLGGRSLLWVLYNSSLSKSYLYTDPPWPRDRHFQVEGNKDLN